MFKGLILVLHPWHRVRVVRIDIKFPKAFYEFNKSDLVEEELYDAWWKWNKINRMVCVCVCVCVCVYIVMVEEELPKILLHSSFAERFHLNR